MSDTPDEEMIEQTQFILMGQIYQKTPQIQLSEHFDKVPEEYRKYGFHAITGILYEEWVMGTFGNDNSDIGADIIGVQMTEKGRVWYQNQVIKNESKWKKLFKYIGNRVLEKTINKVL